MTPPPALIPSTQDAPPARRKFIQHLATLTIKPNARDYYLIGMIGTPLPPTC
jgi:hypothetical protein